MKDKALYLIVGLLLGVIVMQAKQGPQPVQAQAPEVITGYSMGVDGDFRVHYVMLSNGDVYANHNHESLSHPKGLFAQSAEYRGNFWTGQTVQTNQESWGGVKSKYEGKN